MPMQREIRGAYIREAEFQRDSVDETARTVEVAMSSEAPVERWFGTEILDHGKGSVDLGRMKSGAPVLMDHNTRDQVGVVENVRLDEDRVLRGTLRFGRSIRASEILQDVVDGIRSKISIGYSIGKYETTKGSHGAPDKIRAVRWEPMEVSFVAVPADDSVGVGRSLDPEDGSAPNPTTAAVPAATTEVRAMPAELNPPAVAPQAAPTPEPASIEQLRTSAAREVMAALELGRALGLEDVARELIGSGTPSGEINTRLMDESRKRAPKPIPAGGSLEDLGLSKKEVREYNMARAIFSEVARLENRPSAAGGLEREVSEALRPLMPANYSYRGGIIVPFATRAGLDSINSTAGAELNYTVYGGELIELFRNRSVAIRAGARFLSGLTSALSFPRQTGGSSGAWKAENSGADASESDATFDTVTLTPNTYIATTSFSRQLEVLGVADAESIIRNDLATAHALAWDRAYIHGAGTAEPLGLYGISGINTKAMGGAVAYGEMLDMVAEVAKDNALQGNLAFITTIGMANKLLQTLSFSAAGSDTIWRGMLEEGTVCGHRALASNQVSSLMNGSTATGGSEHGIVFGNHGDAIIGAFGPGVEVVLDPYRLKKQGMIEATSFGMVDIIFRHDHSFCKATGATLA